MVESGRRLATKIYPNGVEVIIKGIQPSPIPGKGTPPEWIDSGHLPTTLPPTTVSNQFHLLSHPNRPNTAIDYLLHSMARSVSPDLLTRTMMTTFTYYQTILQNHTTLISSTEQTLSNVITLHGDAFPVEETQSLDMTHVGHDWPKATPVAQLQITPTDSGIVGSETSDMASQNHLEVATMNDLILTHSPIKTFYTTFTTFLTSLDGSSEVISTSTSVTSHVQTPSLLSSTPHVTHIPDLTEVTKIEPIHLQPVMIYATKTFYTTTTFLTSMIGDGNETRITSRTSVVSNVVTEIMSTVLNGHYLQEALQSSYLAQHQVSSGEEMKATVLAHPELSIRTIQGSYVPDEPTQIYPHWPKDVEEGIGDMTVIHSTPSLHLPQIQELGSEIHHIIQELVSPTSTQLNVYPTGIHLLATPPLNLNPMDPPQSSNFHGVGNKKSGTVFGNLPQPIGEENQIQNLLLADEREEVGGITVPGLPDYYDEVKEETAFKETYSDEGEIGINVTEEPTTQMSLETLQQEILDEIPSAPPSTSTDRMTLKFTSHGKPIKFLPPEEPERTRRPIPPPGEDYDENPESLGNVYHLILPKPPLGSSSSGDEAQGSGSQDDENKKEDEESEEGEKGPESLQRRPSFGGSHLAPPPQPQDVTISQTGTGINWNNPLLKLGALGLGGLGASAFTKWSPFLGSMSGLLKTAGAGLVPILARNDTSHYNERPMRMRRPFRGQQSPVEGNIPRRPVVTHANEPNFRFENGPPSFGQGGWGQKPMDMRVVLTPVGNGHGHQQSPSSNIVRVVAGNPHFRPPATRGEKPVWTNQVILPLPPESNEIQEASEEITRLRPPPQYPRPQFHQNKPPGPKPIPPNYFQKQEESQGLTFKPYPPPPTPFVGNEAKAPAIPPNFKERRPSSPIPTGISTQEVQRPRRPTSPPPRNQIQEQGHKKVEKIPQREERPTIPPPTLPTEKQIPQTQLHFHPGRPTSFANFHSGEMKGPPFGNGQGPVSLEFIPHMIRPFQQIPVTSQRPAVPFQFNQGQEGRRPAESGEKPHHHRPPPPPSTVSHHPVKSRWEEPEGILGMYKPGGHLNPFNKPQHQRPQFIRASSEESQRHPSINHHHPPQNHQVHFHPRPQTVFIPMNPHTNFPTIGLSSEEVLSPGNHPIRKRPQVSMPTRPSVPLESQEPSQEEFQVREPGEGFRRPSLGHVPRPLNPQPIPPPPQRFPFGSQGLYEMKPGGLPPRVLLPGNQPHPPAPTLNSQILLPGWGSMEREKPQPTPHFPPYQLNPSTVYIVEETYDPPPTLPSTQHQLIIKEIRKEEPVYSSPITTTNPPIVITQSPRPTFLRRSTTTQEPLRRSTSPPIQVTSPSSIPSSTGFSYGLFPQGFQFSNNIQQVLNRVAPSSQTNRVRNGIKGSRESIESSETKRPISHPPKIQTSSEVKGQGSAERDEGGSSVQIELKGFDGIGSTAKSPQLSSMAEEEEDKLSESEEEALLQAFRPSGTNSSLSPGGRWEETTFRPIHNPFPPTTFRNELNPTTYRSNNGMRATTFRPRRPLLSNPPNQIQHSSYAPPFRKPWESVDENEGLDQVKLKNVEIHKTVGFMRPKGNGSLLQYPSIPFRPNDSDEENQVGAQEGDSAGDTYETYEDRPPGFPASRLTPPPPPQQNQRPGIGGQRPLLRRPIPPEPRPRPFDSFTNIFRHPPAQGPAQNGPGPGQRWPPPKPFLPPVATREKEEGIRPRPPIIFRKPTEPPRQNPPSPDYTIANNFHKVRPIPLNPAQGTLPPPTVTQSTTTRAPPDSHHEENEVEENESKGNGGEREPMGQRPPDLRPAADGDPFYESEEEEEEEEEDSQGSPLIPSEVNNGNRHVGGHLLNPLPRPAGEEVKEDEEPRVELEPPPIDSNRLRPPVMELPSNGPIRIRPPKPNLLRPEENVLRPDLIGQKPSYHTIATVDEENKIIRTNLIPAFLPTRPRPQIQPSRTRTESPPQRTETERPGPQLIGSVETVDLHGPSASGESQDKSSVVKYSKGSMTVHTSNKLDNTFIKPTRTFRPTSRVTPTILPRPTPPNLRNPTPFTNPELIRTPPPTSEPIRTISTSISTDAMEDEEESSGVGESSPIHTPEPPGDVRIKNPPLYKPRKPFMPIRNPQEGILPPWRQRVTTSTSTSTNSPPTRRSPFIFTRRTTTGPPSSPNVTFELPSSTTTGEPKLIVPKINTTSPPPPLVFKINSTSPSPPLESSEEEESDELLVGEGAEMSPTTFRPAIRPQYFSTPPPRDNLTTTTLITKEGAVLAVIKRVSTSSSVSTRLPIPKPSPTTRYVTHSGTLTQTFTETETRILPSISERVGLVTETIIVTRIQPPETQVSTIIGGATIINTIHIQPTMVSTTILSQQTEVPTMRTTTVRPIEIEPDVKKVVVIGLPTMSTGLKPTPSSGKNGKILEGGSGILVLKSTPPPPTLLTSPPKKQENVKGVSNCTKATCSNGNQVCRGGVCGCKPGYARMKPTFPCRPTFTYEMSVSVKDLEEGGMKMLSSGSGREYMGETKEALETAFLTTDLKRQFQGTEVMKFKPLPSRVYVDFLVQMTVNMTEDRIRTQLIRTLRNSNFSVQGLGVLSPEASSEFSARDFNECLNPDYHDCSLNSDCVNLRGSFTCICKEGFRDRKKQRPGRDCSSLAGCSECNYKGNCGREKNGQATCDCFRWYGGADCRWNLKVLLLGVIGVVSLLLLLVIISLVLICRRKTRTPVGNRERQGSGRFMRYRSPTSQATLERTAIMHETGSSTGSEDTVIQPIHHQRNPSYTPDSLVETGTGHRGQGRKSQNNLTNYTLGPSAVDPHDISPMNVVIPRAKIRQSPTTGSEFMRSEAGPSGATPGPSGEQRLINYLEGGTRGAGSSRNKQPSSLQRDKEAQAFRKLSLQERRIPSGALVSSGTEVSARGGGGMRRRSTGIEPEFPPRVYDKNLSDIRSSRASCYSCNKPSSYTGGYTESGGHTMAEKDGASTVYTVQGKLFRLARDTDSNLSSD